MSNKKTKDELLAEKVSAEKKLEQYTHQLQRAVNREKYLVKGEAKKRTIFFAILAGLSSVFGRKYSICLKRNSIRFLKNWLNKQM